MQLSSLRKFLRLDKKVACRSMFRGRFRPTVEALEDRIVFSIDPTGFTGMSYTDTYVGVPPDPNGAVGPDYIVELVNSNIAVYNKQTGAQASTESLQTFFSSLNPGSFLSDPVVAYDEQSGHFIVGVLDLQTTGSGAISGDRFLFAVSNDSNPNDGFSEMHAINMTEAGLTNSEVFADYPRIGWNADSYVFTFNMFGTGNTGGYDHVDILAIDKASAIDKNNSTFTYKKLDGPAGSNDFTLAPATMHGSVSGDPMYFVEGQNDGGSGNTIRVVKATGLLSNNASFTPTTINVNSYSMPPAATQPDGGYPIETNDTRILNVEWRRLSDGTQLLAASQTVGGSDGLAHARWYGLDTQKLDTDPTQALLQQQTIGVNSGNNSYFPSVAIDPNGDLGMTFIESSTSQYMSMYVDGATYNSSTSSWTPATPVVAKAGEMAYYSYFGDYPYRAGDFSGTTVDPTDGSFWSVNEYANSDFVYGANWGTYIAHFSVAPPAPMTDIAVTQITAAPSTVVQGDKVTVQVTVKNVGNQDVTANIPVSLVDKTDNFTIGNQTVSGLAAGASQTLTFSWTTSSATTAGTNTLTATANLTGDQNASNNSKSTTVTVQAPKTDLAVTQFTASPTTVVQGSSVNFSVSVTNVGNQTVSNTVQLTDTTTNTVIGSQDINSLAPGNSTTLTFTWNTSASTTTGSHSFTAALTSNDDDNTNNSKSTSVTVEAPKIDLAVTQLTATPTTVYQGNSVNFSVSVTNDGNETASNTVKLTDMMTGTIIGSQNISLTAGKSMTVKFSWNTSTSTATGSHSFTAALTSSDSNNNNNSQDTTVTVDKPSAGTSFPGLNFSDTAGYVPPDTGIAVGKNYVVETVNTEIAIYNKDGTAASFGTNGKEDLHTFFHINSGLFISDPAISYDDIASRFVVSTLELNGGSTYLLFAVSNSSDPTAGFSAYSIDVSQYSYYFGTLQGDFPRLGWNADEYVVTLNMFSAYGFNNVQVITLDKSMLLNYHMVSGTSLSLPAPDSFTWYPDFTLVPATMHGAQPGGPMYFVEEALNAYLQPTNQLYVVSASNLLTSPTLTYTTISVNPYSAPPAATQLGGATISTNDSRILSVDWRNNQLVAAQTVGVNSAAQARWYEFSTSGTPTLTQEGTINPGSGVNTYYPSVAIAPNGNVGMTFIQSSSSQYMSMYVTQAPYSSTPFAMEMQTPVLAKAGRAPYSPFDSSPYRAGDFSGIAVDPTNGTFWAANEYATNATSSAANWGTFISNFGTPTNVNVAITGSTSSSTSTGTGRGHHSHSGGRHSYLTNQLFGFALNSWSTTSRSVDAAPNWLPGSGSTGWSDRNDYVYYGDNSYRGRSRSSSSYVDALDKVFGDFDNMYSEF